MNRLQTLKAEREFCVTLNHGHAIAPDKVIRTIPYAHPVYTAAGEAAQAPAPRDQRPPHAHPLRRRVLGLGFPRGRREVRRAGGPGPRSQAAVSESAIYTGHVRHRRFAVRNHEFRYPLTMALHRPRRGPRAPRRPAHAQATRPGAVPPEGLPRRGGDAAAGRGAASSSRRAWARPARTHPPAHPPAHARPLLQPGVLLLLLRARRPDARRRRRRGHEHAVGRAPRVRPRGWKPDRQPGRLRQGPPRLAVHAMDQRYTWRAPAPGETLSVHIESTQQGSGRSTRRSTSTRRAARCRAGCATAHLPSARPHLRPRPRAEAQGGPRPARIPRE